MHLLAPSVHAFAPEESKDEVGRILTGLVQDEVRHISYTAKLIEKFANEGEFDDLNSLYRRRLRDFNALTFEQTKSAAAEYGQSLFPELLRI